MKTYLLNLWDAIRTSYWFVPSLFAAAAVLLSVVMPVVDAAIEEPGKRLPDWIRTTTPTARTTLSAIAGAMVAVTGTVFSITIVTLSLASQQFGPRLLRRFMVDLPTQLTLGVFLATGFYCLLLLRTVESQKNAIGAPHLAVFVAVVLATLSMAMLIVFIHHVAMLIQSPNVVASVAHDLDESIDRMFPEKIGDPPQDDRRQRQSAGPGDVELDDHFVNVQSNHEGYIQAIDGDRLLRLAVDADLVIRMRARPGDFLAVGAPLADVWNNQRGDADDDAPQRLTRQLGETLIVGVRRTPRQDVECAVNELVEVAVRSLSPGVNDPFTAMNCIDRLGAALGRLAQRRLPVADRYDDDGRLRIITRPYAFADVLDSALNQIRQYGRDSVAVTIRMLESLAFIAGRIERHEDRQAVELHADMIARHRERFVEEYDRQAVHDRLGRIQRLLNAAPRCPEAASEPAHRGAKKTGAPPLDT